MSEMQELLDRLAKLENHLNHVFPICEASNDSFGCFAYLGRDGNLVGDGLRPYLVTPEEAESFLRGGSALVYDTHGPYCGIKADLAESLVRILSGHYFVERILSGSSLTTVEI